MLFCPSTNGVKSLKETQSAHSNHWPDLIFSSYTTRFLMEEKRRWSLYTVASTQSALAVFYVFFYRSIRQFCENICRWINIIVFT